MNQRFTNFRTLGARYRCVEGRLLRHDPQPDDPDLETDVGQCAECGGDGCEKQREDDELWQRVTGR